MEETIGLKVKQGASLAKCVSIIRKLESLSISDIKEKIDTASYLLVYDATDDTGLERIISCYEKLKEIGIESCVFWLGEEVPIQTLYNLSQTYKEIDAQFDPDLADLE